MSKLFSTFAVLMLTLGILFVVFPEFMLNTWGTKPDALACYMAQRYGVMFFGYATMLWLMRQTQSISTQRVILIGVIVAGAGMAIISTKGVISGTVNSSGWLAVIVEVLLVVSAAVAWFKTKANNHN